jgi:hypothetical protein
MFSNLGHILGHKRNLDKQEYQNNILYFTRSKWNKTGNQQQEKLQELYK